MHAEPPPSRPEMTASDVVDYPAESLTGAGSIEKFGLELPEAFRKFTL